MTLRFLMIVNCRSLVMAQISMICWNCLVFPYNLLCSSFLVMFPFHYWMWKFFLSLLTHFSPHLSQFLTPLPYFARFSKEWCNLSKKTPLPHYLQGGSMFLTVCGLIAMALTPSSTFPTSPRSLITGRLPSLNHFGGMREMWSGRRLSTNHICFEIWFCLVTLLCPVAFSCKFDDHRFVVQRFHPSHGKISANPDPTLGEISSDLYGLSGCDILNLTFCRLDFHQLLIKIS